MNSIRDEIIALDTNVFLFALRKDADHPACETLLFDKINELQLYLPLQVFLELQRHLTGDELRQILRALFKAKTFTWDYTLASPERITTWEQCGAKKGDAVIIAHLETAGIRCFISENRHFLAEVPDLPFSVWTSATVLQLLEQDDNKS